MTKDLSYREFNSLKIIHHIDRLKALSNSEDIAPVTVEIDPVAYCNHNCGWCVDPLHKSMKMDESLYSSLINELVNFSVNGFKVEGIVFKGGGEPTLHPKFGNMLKKAIKKGFAVGVVTNGSRLKKWAQPLAKKASYVRISVDGPTPESHARVHQSNDFELILHGICDLVRYRGNNRHPIIGLSFAIDIHSMPLIDQAILLGEELGVDYVLMRPPFFEEVGRESTMSIVQARHVRQNLIDKATAYKGSLHIVVDPWIGDAEQQSKQSLGLNDSGRRGSQKSNKQPIEHRTKQCWASPVLAAITADGMLYGCCNLRALPQWSMGQLDYTNGTRLKDLWEGQRRREALAKMHKTECINHCTHPLSRYNEIIEVYRDKEKPHSQFL